VNKQVDYSPEAEEGLLGCLLYGKADYAKIFSLVEPDFFSRNGHKIIYETIMFLFGEEKLIDTVTVIDCLKRHGVLERVGGSHFITGLFSEVHSPAKALQYAKMIRKYALDRKDHELAYRAYKGDEAALAQIRQNSHTSQNSLGVFPGQSKSESLLPAIKKDLLTPSLLVFLEIASPTTDAPDEFLVSSLIGGWAGAVGNKIKGPNGLRPNIWVVNFAGSSEPRKTTALNTAKEPLAVIQQRFDAGLKEELAKYKSDNLRWESLPKDKQAETREPEKPTVWNLLLSGDFSDAGFYEMMKNNPCSGVIVTGEFADFHRKLNREYTGMVDAFLSAYDGDRMVRQTRNSGTEVIEEPTFSLLGTTTFENFRRVFRASEAENGFLQRILPVVVIAPTKSRMLLLDRKEVCPSWIDETARKIKKWLDLKGELKASLSSELTEDFKKWESRFVSEAKNDHSDGIGPFVERMVTSCLKLSILLESLEIEDPKLSTLYISEGSLKCAQMLIDSLFLPSIVYLREHEIFFSRERGIEKKIEKTIKKACAISLSQLLRETRLTAREAAQAIETLTEKDLIRSVKESKKRAQGGGNPKTIYIWKDGERPHVKSGNSGNSG